jgi:hypothetical protein
LEHSEVDVRKKEISGHVIVSETGASGISAAALDQIPRPTECFAHAKTADVGSMKLTLRP